MFTKLIDMMLKLTLTLDHIVGWYACSICECPLISDIATTGGWKKGEGARGDAFQTIWERDSL